MAYGRIRWFLFAFFSGPSFSFLILLHFRTRQWLYLLTGCVFDTFRLFGLLFSLYTFLIIALFYGALFFHLSLTRYSAVNRAV